MSTIIKFFTLYLVLISCTHVENNKISCYIKLSNDNISYNLINDNNIDYYIPINYEYNIVKNDLICESHFKSDITEYNQFGVPKFQILKSNSEIKGNIKLQKKIINKTIYCRIYTKKVEEYAKEKKLKTLTEFDYLEYEKSNSFLVIGVSE